MYLENVQGTQFLFKVGRLFYEEISNLRNKYDFIENSKNSTSTQILPEQCLFLTM